MDYDEETPVDERQLESEKQLAAADEKISDLLGQIANLTHDLANNKLMLDEAQRRIDMLAQLLSGKEAELTVANARIAELNAQLTAIAADAVNWVDRAELDEKLGLAEDYAHAQWLNRHHSRNFQRFPDWLASLEPVQ